MQLSESIASEHHVFTLRAELEGMKFLSAFEQLVSTWKSNGYQLVTLGDIHSTLNVRTLPLHTIQFAEMPGRSGLRMKQGPAFLQD